MTEERIVRTETPAGDPNTPHSTHTTHTVITDEPRRGTSWVLILLVLVLLVAGIWFLTQMGSSEAAKDNAIADAATEVGEAAGQVGEAAQGAGEAVEDAVTTE